LFALLIAGCALEAPSESGGDTGAADPSNGDERVASVSSPVYCVASWVRVQPALTSCYIDKDTHFLYYTLEVNGADLYHDANGCFPDAYKIRRLDTIRCTANISLDNCLGKWSQAPLVSGKALVGTNHCPSPLVSSFPPSTGEPPVCQTTRIDIGMTCNESWCAESFGRACSAAGGQTGVDAGGWFFCQRTISCN
jgi:hypothetical protein